MDRISGFVRSIAGTWLMLGGLINPLHLFFALGPVALYFLLMGLMNLSSRPMVATGARDAAALGLGIGGLVILGPMQLLLPASTISFLGPFVWLLLAIFYGLLLALLVLLLRPRIVVYNISTDRLRPILANLAAELDTESRWAGGCLTMPQLEVQLHVEALPAFRNVQLVAAGPRQNYEGWRRLQQRLAEALRETRGARNPLGFALVACALVLLFAVGLVLVRQADTVAQTVQELFRAGAVDGE